MVEYIAFAVFLAVLSLAIILFRKKRKRKNPEPIRLEDTWMDVFPEVPEDFS